MSTRFCWYELRTTAPSEARAFYAEVVGADIREEAGRQLLHLGGQSVGEVSALPERAAAMGAPSHWLGHLSVADVNATADRLVALGAQRLGPARRTAAGASVSALRDPFGAVLALTDEAHGEQQAGLAWHELYTRDHGRASALYAELFGWRLTQVIDLGHEVGRYQMFSWRSDAQSVGGMISTTRLPHVHPHWLFYFQVDDLDQALAVVASRGGRVLQGPRTVPGGARVAQCEDPQHAAFALHEAPKPA